jgi:hypothetical protein
MVTKKLGIVSDPQFAQSFSTKTGRIIANAWAVGVNARAC